MTHSAEEQTVEADVTPAAPHDHQGQEGSSISLFALLRLLRSAGGALFAQAALHGQLARVEWQEERERLLQMLLAALLGFACVLALLLLCSALLLLLSWDTPYRIPALIGLLLLHGLGCIIAWRRFQALAARSSESFAATRAELAADLALLRSSL